jgi:segregation and condensation protein B
MHMTDQDNTTSDEIVSDTGSESTASSEGEVTSEQDAAISEAVSPNAVTSESMPSEAEDESASEENCAAQGDAEQVVELGAADVVPASEGDISEEVSAREAALAAAAASLDAISTGTIGMAQEDGPEDRALHVGLVEAILFANGDPADLERLLLISRLNEDQLQRALSTLKERGSSDASGCELVQVAGKYQLRTKAMFSEYLREIKAEPPRRLSAAALETLAIVAYRQPIVRSDVEKIRGVDCTPTIKTLLERGLIKILGHQASVGQPALYGTTEEFLKLFGLNSLSELPTLRDLQELERDPGESEEVDEEPASSKPAMDTGEDIRPTAANA